MWLVKFSDHLPCPHISAGKYPIIKHLFTLLGCHWVIFILGFRLRRLKRLFLLNSLRLGRPLLHCLRLLTVLRRVRRRGRLIRRLRSLPRANRRLHHHLRFLLHHPHAMAGRGAPERQARAWLYGWWAWELLAGPGELGQSHTSQQDK